MGRPAHLVLSQSAMETVLVYGAGGWIGGLLKGVVEARGLRFLPATARGDEAAAVRAEVARVTPRLVFAALGRTHGVCGERTFGTIDYLEQPGKLVENLRDNLVAPLVLAGACRELGVPFASIATGCIFQAADLDAIAEAPGFADDAEPNFTGSSYSCVKGATDRLLRALFADSALWFRIRMPLTHDLHPRSFLTKIASYEKVCSVPNSMSVLDGDNGLLRLFLEMALAGYRGCYNGCNPGVLSHNDILAMYKAEVEPSFAWQNFTLEEQAAVLAAGRSNNRLCSRRLEAAAAELGIPLPDLRTAVRGIMKHLARRRTRSSCTDSLPRCPQRSI